MWKSLEVASDFGINSCSHRSLVPQLTNATCEINRWLLYMINGEITWSHLIISVFSFSIYYFWEIFVVRRYSVLDARKRTAVYLYYARLVVFEHSTSRVACLNKFTHTHTHTHGYTQNNGPHLHICSSVAHVLVYKMHLIWHLLWQIDTLLNNWDLKD